MLNAGRGFRTLKLNVGKGLDQSALRKIISIYNLAEYNLADPSSRFCKSAKTPRFNKCGERGGIKVKRASAGILRFTQNDRNGGSSRALPLRVGRAHSLVTLSAVEGSRGSEYGVNRGAVI